MSTPASTIQAMPPLDRDAWPLFLQIADALRVSIADGYQGKLPSESELCKRYGVTRPTVRMAVKVLADEGLVRSFKGRGTFTVEGAQERASGDGA